MAGSGIGLSLSPAAIHARFSQPDNRVAVVTALLLFVSVSPYRHVPSPIESTSPKLSVARLVLHNALLYSTGR